MQPNDSRRRACLQCGRTFFDVHPSHNRRFCSRECGYTSRRSDPAARFWTKVDRAGGDDACWIWTGARYQFGYGRFRLPTTHTPAHRFSWELHRGPIRDGLHVLHNCPGGDNPSCVNPRHLFLGTNDDNMADMVTKGRAARGERSAQAKLTAEDIRAIRATPWVRGSGKALAARYGVNDRAISAIRYRQVWKHVV